MTNGDRRTPAQRSMSARAAAHERWARTTQTERAKFAADARAGQLARWDRAVDPDGVLSQAERARRAENAMKAHMSKMALASSRARASRRKLGRG